jgi:hypothetical protein
MGIALLLFGTKQMQGEVAVVYFKILSKNLSTGTEENYAK